MVPSSDIQTVPTLSKFETADEMFLQRFIYPRYLGAFNIPLVVLIPAPKDS